MSQVKFNFGKIFGLVDFIIAGPHFEHKRIQNVPFVSSSNPQTYCLSARAKEGLENYSFRGDYEVVIFKGGSAVAFL